MDWSVRLWMTALLASACAPAVPPASSPSASSPPDRSETVVIATPESPPPVTAPVHPPALTPNDDARVQRPVWSQLPEWAPPPGAPSSATPHPAALPPTAAIRDPYERKWYRYLPIAQWPREIPYDDKAPPVPGYHVESRVRLPFVIGGLGAFVLAYGLTSAFVGPFKSGPAEPELYAPVAGPLFMIRDIYATIPGDWLVPLLEPFAALLLITDAIVQLGGLGVCVAGLAAQKKILVRDLAKTSPATPALRFDGNRLTLVF